MKVACAMFLLAGPVSGFLFPNDRIEMKPGLIQAVESTKTKSMAIKLEVGVKPESRLTINDLKLDFSPDPVVDGSQHPAMPGVNGPHPQLSGGVRTLQVKEDGWFIDMTGKKDVQLKNGCWELIWRDGALAGTLVCGFDVTESYTRNAATLSPCRLYMSFPVWSSEGLKTAQKDKKTVMDRAKGFVNEKELEIAKMKETSNPIMKALHYRNAYAAMDKYSMENVKAFDMVPSDEEVLTFGLDQDMLVTTKGLAFSKEGGFQKGQHVLLGAAYAAEV
mmetsp:Transcript_8916/g.13712  ORF Transcript_8916/g.13712 Transcript_8916/m.13712 type:complete len:276 (+) Transcript_8916:141-968(+)|eukprot:CAMPEP_0178927012 /NCGR_PEP_ID=MMETSP0786-20121207/18901_1 /TAXON_ID=186022 /ORGANISM="Thalassionema frauenfeldii, Strain CCMP 1798" /LENGTH=275 /DNA_ID=CAMNT_0020602297 /DNA_START=110 /DNA_END=937 /DNA_ORIENTATION=+